MHILTKEGSTWCGAYQTADDLPLKCVRGKKIKGVCHDCKEKVIADDRRRMLHLRSLNLTPEQVAKAHETWDD